MSENAKPDSPATEPGRKPRIAIMGEFSAGKSTLSNLLIGAPALPVKVTATQLPPVWISAGDEAPYSVDLAGNRLPVDLTDIASISVEETQHIRVFHQADVLEQCDLVDMPGISDPNMSAEVWERAASLADAVIWCTHATQAWRQSEAAVWATFPPELHDRSLLLLTRFDKIVGERDRARLVRRVISETEGLFSGVFPVALLRALEAGEEDFEAWEASGAHAFATALFDLVSKLSAPVTARPRPVAPRPPAAAEVAEVAVAPALDRPAPADVAPVEVETAGPSSPPASEGRVIPQRVSRRSSGSRGASRPG